MLQWFDFPFNTTRNGNSRKVGRAAAAAFSPAVAEEEESKLAEKMKAAMDRAAEAIAAMDQVVDPDAAKARLNH